MRKKAALPEHRELAALRFLLLCAGILLSVLLRAQTTAGYSAPSSNDESGDNDAAVKFRSSQDPFSGSVPEGKATSDVLPLSFKEAIDRGLRNNLGLLLQSDAVMSARGERWKELSNLLPNVNASLSENVVQADLAAIGFRFPGIPLVIGPYNYFDARASVSQSIFDWHAVQRERGASASERAERHSYQDAREMVVLAVGNAYLLALAAAARVDTAQAQIETAQAVYDKSVNQRTAGVSPAIDALRAQVELQARQQQHIVSRNDYAKRKLTLARIIGLPSGQEFSLSEKAPYEPLAALGIEESLKRAYGSRSDYQAAVQQVRSAEYFRKAASAEHMPTIGMNADYGAQGVNFGNSHGVFQVSGVLNIPIFQGGKAHADTLKAEATLQQSRQRLDDLRGRIDYEVRTALLDLAAAAEQVEVARSSVDLAGQTLVQARDRFSAGVADNLEVIQAQESVASANESYISSLYAHNVAKVAFARAIGYAEQGVREYLMKSK